MSLRPARQATDQKSSVLARAPRTPASLARRLEPVAVAAFAVALVYVTLIWRLGIPTFWDPDEAHYAETSREMIASGDWLAPYYNDEPFFDKPALFHILQGGAMSVFGANEFGARIVPALAALALIVLTAWVGRGLASPAVALVASLLLAASPGVFARVGVVRFDVRGGLRRVPRSAPAAAGAAMDQRPGAHPRNRGAVVRVHVRPVWRRLRSGIRAGREHPAVRVEPLRQSAWPVVLRPDPGDGPAAVDRHRRRPLDRRRGWRCPRQAARWIRDSPVDQGKPLAIVYEREGMFATSGRALWRRRLAPAEFVVVRPAR